MFDVDAIKNLFERYVDGHCTPAEVKQLMQYFHADEIGQLNQLIRTDLERPDENNDIDYHQNIDRVYERIQKRLIPEKRTWKLW